MKEFVEFLGDLQLIELSKDPRVLVGAAALFLVALLLRWKFVAALLFGLAGVVAVFRFYGAGGDIKSSLGEMIFFVGGIVAVGIILIYVVFIRGD